MVLLSETTVNDTGCSICVVLRSLVVVTSSYGSPFPGTAHLLRSEDFTFILLPVVTEPALGHGPEAVLNDFI